MKGVVILQWPRSSGFRDLTKSSGRDRPHDFSPPNRCPGSENINRDVHITVVPGTAGRTGPVPCFQLKFLQDIGAGGTCLETYYASG